MQNLFFCYYKHFLNVEIVEYYRIYAISEEAELSAVAEAERDGRSALQSRERCGRG